MPPGLIPAPQEEPGHTPIRRVGVPLTTTADVESAVDSGCRNISKTVG
jgi:hypothetical protein